MPINRSQRFRRLAAALLAAGVAAFTMTGAASAAFMQQNGVTSRLRTGDEPQKWPGRV